MSYDPAAVGPRAVNPIEEGLFTLLAEELTIAEDKKEETKKGEEAVPKPSVDEQHALYSIGRLVLCGQILLKRKGKPGANPVSKSARDTPQPAVSFERLLIGRSIIVAHL